MNQPPLERVRLVDHQDEAGRTTATLLASLAARLGVLHLVTGADAVGSLVAGFAALGRDASLTADGARLRRAIESGRASTNGQALWSALHVEDWVSSLPASPILDHLRNDLALLLADDLDHALDLLPIPNEMQGARGADSIAHATFVDCLMGLWAYSVELVRAVELLAGPRLAPEGSVARSNDPASDEEGPLLQ